MLNLRPVQHGVTLIELMVAMVVFAILVALAIPSYRQWIQNQQIRAAAESILNGIQLARATAVNNNSPVRFNLCGSNSSWQVLAASAAAAVPSPADVGDPYCSAGLSLATPGWGKEIRIQERSSNEGSALATVSANSTWQSPVVLPINPDGSASVTFNGLGQVVTNDPNVAASSVAMIEVTTPTGSRPLIITVRNPGGATRMCDPSTLLVNSDPRHC